jgi:hypothetical protein
MLLDKMDILDKKKKNIHHSLCRRKSYKRRCTKDLKIYWEMRR